MLVYSVTSPSSLQNLQEKWVLEVRHHVPNAAVFLVGCKGDLYDDESKEPETIVSSSQAKKAAEDMNAVGYIACSALKPGAFSIEDVFEEIVRKTIKAQLSVDAGDGCCTIL
jgi:GTPase SAR1 family protein